MRLRLSDALHVEGARPWREEVLRSLRAVQMFLRPKLFELPLPEVEPREWEKLVFKNGVAWQNSLRKFLVTVPLQRCRWQQIVASIWEGETDSSSDGEFLCQSCGRTFAAKWASLQSHRSIAHGWRNPLRQYISGSRCPSCGVDFRSRARCLAHALRSSKFCRERLEAGCCPPVSEEELAAADRADQIERVACRQSGVSILSGPPCIKGSVPSAA